MYTLVYSSHTHAHAHTLDTMLGLELESLQWGDRWKDMRK